MDDYVCKDAYSLQCVGVILTVTDMYIHKLINNNNNNKKQYIGVYIVSWIC